MTNLDALRRRRALHRWWPRRPGPTTGAARRADHLPRPAGRRRHRQQDHRQLLLLAADPDKDIFLYIDSPGGSIAAGMAIYDTMQFIQERRGDDRDGARGLDGAVPPQRGHPGQALRGTERRDLMIHQPSAGLAGSASDIKIHAERLLHTKKRMAEADVPAHRSRRSSRSPATPDRDRWTGRLRGQGVRPHRRRVIPTAAGMPGGGGTGPEAAPRGPRVCPGPGGAEPSPSAGPVRPVQPAPEPTASAPSQEKSGTLPRQRPALPHACRVHRPVRRSRYVFPRFLQRPSRAFARAPPCAQLFLGARAFLPVHIPPPSANTSKRCRRPRVPTTPPAPRQLPIPPPGALFPPPHPHLPNAKDRKAPHPEIPF